jgi:hypothetical protein
LAVFPPGITGVQALTNTVEPGINHLVQVKLLMATRMASLRCDPFEPFNAGFKARQSRVKFQEKRLNFLIIALSGMI